MATSWKATQCLAPSVNEKAQNWKAAPLLFAHLCLPSVRGFLIFTLARCSNCGERFHPGSRWISASGYLCVHAILLQQSRQNVAVWVVVSQVGLFDSSDKEKKARISDNWSNVIDVNIVNASNVVVDTSDDVETQRRRKKFRLVGPVQWIVKIMFTQPSLYSTNK